MSTRPWPIALSASSSNLLTLPDSARHWTLNSIAVTILHFLLRHAHTRGHPPSGYFIPKHLVARLRHIPQLEELLIGFAIPIPRPKAEPPPASICLPD